MCNIAAISEVVNQSAEAYAQTRNSWNLKYLRNGKENAELLERSWEDENFVKCILKTQEFIQYLPSHANVMNTEFTKEIIKALLRFEPTAQFTTFFSMRIEREAHDWQVQENNRQKIMKKSIIYYNQPLNNEDETQGELLDMIADERIPEMFSEGLRLWGAFGCYLADLRDGKEKVNGKILRFPVYATRDYILLVCPNISYINQIEWVESEIMIDSPYMRFLREENVQNIAQATLQEAETLTATGVYLLYANNNLINERYENQSQFNNYFNMTNLNSDYNRYKNIRIAFMTENINRF